jgi:hypothetical protein
MVRAIGNNKDSASPSQVSFTPARATKMLPLVRRIVEDILQLQQAIDLQTHQLKVIDSLPETMQQSNYQDEVSDIRSSLAEDQVRLLACIAELNSLGVELHEPFDGAVDFPAECNRRKIRLCWHPDDEEVLYFHEPGQQFAARKKIDPQWFSSESLN